MNVARILYPVEVLGPGRRVGIWVCGCRRGCKGCSNPELWEQRSEYEVKVEEIAELIGRIGERYEIDGFTVSGGEPMDQAVELSRLLEELKRYSEDILVYTGYRIEELQERSDAAAVLAQTAVLIDGEYREEENTDVLLRGSENQRIHILNEKLRDKYEAYLASAHNQIQNFTTRDGVVSVGIHRKGFSS